MLEIEKLKQDIEKSYSFQLLSYNPPTKKVKAKNACAILMARRFLTSGKIWWYAWENIGVHDEFFGSHKMPARMSDLATKHAEYFEGREVGIYKVYRVKFEILSHAEIEMMTLSTFRVEDLYKPF